MLLAAGRGERMRPLTEHCPKALLEAGGHALVEYHLFALARAGFTDIVINTAYLGAMLRDALGDGALYGVRIRYSDEGEQPLETAGGIANALPMLGPRFLVINADIWTDFEFQLLHPPAPSLAHLVLVSNPAHNPRGDFSLQDGLLSNRSRARVTYAGIGVLRAELFAGLAPGAAKPLAPLLRRAADAGHATGQAHDGQWVDVGTPERLAALRARLSGGRASR